MIRLDSKLTTWNLKSAYNGYGAIDGAKNADYAAPMAYRVLVPWLALSIERLVPALRKHRYPTIYLPLKFALIVLMLLVAERAVGTSGALCLALGLCALLHFEYWDNYVEVLGFAAALTGDLRITILGMLLHSLSKPETSPLLSLTFLLSTGNLLGAAWIGAINLLVVNLVRLKVGKRVLYCQRIMWRRNLQDVRELLCNRPFYVSEIGMGLGLTVLTLSAVGVRILQGAPLPAWPVPLILLSAGWIAGRAAESRIFGACLLWVALCLA